MPLDHYRTLGRSGLAVSPLALGTMTFGTSRWGTDLNSSRTLFNRYVDAGGNLIDTADVYAGGGSEEMIGAFVAERGLRDRVVLSTKAGFAAGPHPHAGGIGAKHLRTALHASLKRLRTDYVDVFWAHVWDGVTPAEELLMTMTTIVQSGAARYWAISNAPAWYVAQVATLARGSAAPAPIAMQYFYSLVSREIEAEHLPLAQEFGIAIMPWSPLAYGLLAGKYDRDVVSSSAPRAAGLPDGARATEEVRSADDKRLDGANPFGDSLFTERNWQIVDVVKNIAQRTGHTLARIALSWILGRPSVVSTLIGVSRPAQLDDNIAALDVVLSDTDRAELDLVSRPTSSLLHDLFSANTRRYAVFGGAVVHTRG